MHTTWLDTFMVGISSQILWLSIIFPIAIWQIKNDKSQLRFWLWLTLLVIIADSATYYLIKEPLGRLRPCKIFEWVRAIDGCAGQFSFPSNHATNAMTAVTFVAFIRGRKIGIGLFGLALLVGISRIYLGMHYLTDILGGFILGGIYGSIGAYCFKKIFRGLP